MPWIRLGINPTLRPDDAYIIVFSYMLCCTKEIKFSNFIRFFTSSSQTNCFTVKLNGACNIKISIASLTPYENVTSFMSNHNKNLVNNSKEAVCEWERDAKGINLDIKANRYDFVAFGIGPLDLQLIESMSKVDHKDRDKTSRNRMAMSAFGHFVPIMEQVNSLNLSFGDVGRNKISEMCSFGEATRESPREIINFFYYIAITRNRDRTIKNWSIAIKDNMPTFYKAIVSGNANYIAYNIHKLLKHNLLPQINKSSGIYNMLLVVEQPSFDIVSETLSKNLQRWLDENVSFNEEMKRLSSNRAGDWAFFFAYGVIIPIIISSVTSVYLLITTIRNYRKDGIVSVSGRLDSIDTPSDDEDYIGIGIDENAMVINAEYLKESKCKAFSRKERRERQVVWDYAPKSFFKQSRSLERD